METLRRGENPFALLRKPIFLVQSLVGGMGFAIGSFAYLLAAPSVITAAKRSSAVLWSVLSGNLYFHEKHILIKLAAFALLATGIIVLALA